MERQIDKMHERFSHVVAFDGRLEEFNAPDEQEEEYDEPSDEVHDLNLIFCMEHVIKSTLQGGLQFSLIGRLSIQYQIVIQGFVPAEDKSAFEAFPVFIILFKSAFWAVHIASFKFACCSEGK